MPRRSPVRPQQALLGLLFLLPAACNSTQRTNEEKVIWQVQHGQFEQAVREAERLVRLSPQDPDRQALLRDARIAYVLDQGRQLVFLDELEEALALFDRAGELDSENPAVRSWQAKTRAQLAVEWLDRAAELNAPDQIDEAEAAYEKVLTYAPGNSAAIQGLAYVVLLKNYRSGLSQTYFSDGLSSFRQLELEQARRAFRVSEKYRENEPASQRGEEVEELMAQERLQLAQQLEDHGLFFAARNEYRLVLLIDPSNPIGREGLDRMDRESRANHALSEADMQIRRGQLEEAQETLGDAANLTLAQNDDVALLKSGLEESRLQALYDEASSLTDDYRYPEAIEAFERLLAQSPEFKDAALRKKTLEEFTRLAEEFYPKALAATTDEAAEEYLRAVEIVWPEYKDVQERLRAIEARRTKTPPAPAPEQGGGDPAPDEPGSEPEGGR